MKLLKLQRSKVGLSPGTMVYVGEPRSHAVTLTEVEYNQQTFHQKITKVVPEREKVTSELKRWFHLDGLHNLDVIREVGQSFGLHSLVLEDMVNTGQRPKMEEFDSYMYVVLKWPDVGEDQRFSMQHVNLILGQGFLLTLQEAKGNVFQNIIDRISAKKGRVRTSDLDYLAYALMDNVVDHYFVLLEDLGTRIDSLQDEMLEKPENHHLETIFSIKKDLSLIRHAIWPMREIFMQVLREDKGFFKESTQPFLRDLYDHCIHILEVLETQREMVSALHDLYLSLLGSRSNEVMKVLTIIATIFIPLTFIAGVYGMNFKHMPELDWSWGYPASLVVMLGVAIGLLFFFKRKKWF